MNSALYGGLLTVFYILFVDVVHSNSTHGQKLHSKLILYWTVKNGMKDWGWDFGLGYKCNGKCICTYNKTLLPRADAVLMVLTNPNICLTDLPKHQYRNQIFAAVIYETPHSTGIKNVYKLLKDRRLQNYFNMTVSYRYDSDVVVRYFEVLALNSTRNFNMTSIKRTKQKKAVWIVSHCKTLIHREQFVKELQKYINITILGRCGRKINSFCPHFKQDCLQSIVKDYKFIISFENTLCEQYLTEKGTQFMSLPTIPIIMSYGDPKKHLPPNSYINVFDFKSVKTLADYLLYLDRNQTAYSEYFEWKNKWKIIDHLETRPKVICNICKLLYSDYHKQYGSLADWFVHPRACKVDGLAGFFSDFTPT